MASPILSHNLSRCFSSDSIPWHDIGALWPGPCKGRILRTLDDGTVRSAIVRIGEGSRNAGIGSVAATMQGFVLSGQVVFGDVELGPSGFFVVPTGRALPRMEVSLDTELLLICDEVKTVKPSTAGPVVLTSADLIQPIVPIIDGTRLEGFERRVLWEDPDTGADTRMLTVPKFEGKGPNWHPVHEEIFCLRGDIGPDDERLLTPGYYLHNPAFGVHGYREHSNAGATILEWHDGPWSVNFVT